MVRRSVREPAEQPSKLLRFDLSKRLEAVTGFSRRWFYQPDEVNLVLDDSMRRRLEKGNAHRRFDAVATTLRLSRLLREPGAAGCMVDFEDIAHELGGKERVGFSLAHLSTLLKLQQKADGGMLARYDRDGNWFFVQIDEELCLLELYWENESWKLVDRTPEPGCPWSYPRKVTKIISRQIV